LIQRIDSPVNASVIICTFKRPEALLLTLESFQCQKEVPGGFQWEVIVVDNAVSSLVRDMCERKDYGFPLRYLPEGRPGKVSALNTGIAATTAEWILLTDDDVTVGTDWIRSYAEAFNRHSGASFFGSIVAGELPLHAPDWAQDHPDKLLFLPRYDQGSLPITFDVRGKLPWFIGANMAYRTRALKQVGGFDPNFGPSGTFGSKGSCKMGEESVVMGRMLDAGLFGIYHPGAQVFHRDEPERLTLKYCWWFYSGYGREQVIHDVLPPSWKKGGRLHLGLIKALVGGFVFLALRLCHKKSSWYPCWIQAAKAYGALKAHLFEPELMLSRKVPHSASSNS